MRRRIIKLTQIASFCLFVGFPLVAFGQTSMAEGFASMKLQSSGARHAYARVKFPDGIRAERFILRSGDCPRSTGDCSADRERVEFFDSASRIVPGDEVWYAWSLYLPADFPVPKAGPGTISYQLGQIHQKGRSGPELLFQLDQKGFWIKLTDPYRLDDDPMRPVGIFKRDRVAPVSAGVGRWMRVMVQAKWSRSDDGFINIWINNKMAWRYTGATTNANDRLYFKYGLYRSFVSRCRGPCPDAVAYYRNVKQGKAREEVE